MTDFNSASSNGADEYVQEQLKLDLARRGPAASIIFMCVALFSAVYRFHAEIYSSWILTASILVILANGTRFYFSSKVKPLDSSVPRFRFRMIELSIIANGICWGFILPLVIFFHRFADVDSMLAVSIAIGFSAATPLSLGGSAMLQVLFNFFVVGGMLVSSLLLTYWISNPIPSNPFPIILFLLLVYILLQGRAAGKDLHRRLSYEYWINYERNRLQSVIDSVPGFVICTEPNMQFGPMTQNLAERFGNYFQQGNSIVTAAVSSPLGKVIHQFLKGGQRVHSWETELPDRQEKCWFLISLYRSEKDPNQAVAVGLPINEIMRMRQKLAVETARAENSAQMADFGEKARDLAKRAEQPLSEIRTAIQAVESALNRGTAPSEQSVMDEGLRKIKASSELIASTLQTLVTLPKND